jgi:ABC-type polysaccharide/polyol phosphate transport system ATPase subunit
VDPDILLIDEVLAVGDAAFQTKCIEKIHQFRNAGKSLLCVSHGAATLQELCDHAIWLDHGELVMSGAVDEVLAAYAGAQRAISTTAP